MGRALRAGQRGDASPFAPVRVGDRDRIGGAIRLVAVAAGGGAYRVVLLMYGRRGEGRGWRDGAGRRVETASLAAARVVDGGRAGRVLEQIISGVRGESTHLGLSCVWWAGDGWGWRKRTRKEVVKHRERQRARSRSAGAQARRPRRPLCFRHSGRPFARVPSGWSGMHSEYQKTGTQGSKPEVSVF